MNKKENDIIFTAKEIQNYLEGKLTPEEMHAIEKAALDDAFLADAIEGYESIPTLEWSSQLSSLKENFNRKPSQAKVISITHKKLQWWRIAAAAGVIGIIITTLFVVNNKKENNQIAANNQPEYDSISKTETVNSKQPLLDSITGNLAVVETKKFTTSQTPKVAAVPVESTKADDSFIYTPSNEPQPLKDKAGSAASEATTDAAPSVAAAPHAGNKAAEMNNAANRVASTEKEKQGLDIDQFAEIKKTQQQQTRNFFAQVVGPDNTPLPFANIGIKSENFGTYADINGNFRLISSDSVLTVEVKSLGYKPYSYTLQSNLRQNKIMLVEDNTSVKDNIVVGYGSLAKAKPVAKLEVTTDTTFNAEPSVGWNNYTTYLKNNIQIPEEIEKNNLHGQVELSFDVTTSGTITNIKVDKSLCNNCDEAAKRTIQNGPQWKSKKGKKSRGKVIVEF